MTRLPAVRPVIGVACDRSERAVVRELFELFKTPWGFHTPEGGYDIVIVTAAAGDVRTDARITFAFGSKRVPIDERSGLKTARRPLRGQVLTSAGMSVPLQGPVLTFDETETALALLGDGAPAAVKIDTADGTVIRCGYDLFAEVERLLGEGQDARDAGVATLDLHVAMLRRWLIAEAGLAVEIPPVREGHPYGVCLTHDVDFLGLKRHVRDRTLLGFLYRATLGSVRDVVTGRGSVRRLTRNLLAVASLPLVHLGLRPDPWQPFASYLEADGTPSTFFVIPFRGHGGDRLEPERARRRQVNYDVDDVGTTLRALHQSGHEVAVHGIDGWHSTAAARAELQRVSGVVNEPDLGVRMHWLCFDAQSYRCLDDAGYDYDATGGFNDAVGFKAGTTQVFKPLDAERLLELPLHLQDTALFYAGRLHMSERSAWKATETLRHAVIDTGGVLTVSWHDRSLAPERLWDRFYERLLGALRSDGAWFGTAREVVEWFRLRRTVTFGRIEVGRSGLSVELCGADPRAADAGLLIRVHLANGNGTTVVDVPWRGQSRLDVPLPTAPELVAVAT